MSEKNEPTGLQDSTLKLVYTFIDYLEEMEKKCAREQNLEVKDGV